ncbi:hypothetical protein [Lichenifustis flavocetrariae]|uniref:Uncharacterized protein n=1 Tax=Lichenifustis flavocetrariae TaxID=2949735 RepID=A0AA41Z0C6_9HYPH|nr:hypothetical protein [Lichenifustis flavocetrariae]MCW6511439.1 hypothetical protein [Lichenifustis flavocetrariae]
MHAALDDLRGLMMPRLSVLPTLAIRRVAALSGYHPLGRLLTRGGHSIARRIVRWPSTNRGVAPRAQVCTMHA